MGDRLVLVRSPTIRAAGSAMTAIEWTRPDVSDLDTRRKTLGWKQAGVGVVFVATVTPALLFGILETGILRWVLVALAVTLTVGMAMLFSRLEHQIRMTDMDKTIRMTDSAAAYAAELAARHGITIDDYLPSLIWRPLPHSLFEASQTFTGVKDGREQQFRAVTKDGQFHVYTVEQNEVHPVH